MGENKFFKRLILILLSGLSFIIAYLGPVSYAEISENNGQSASVGNHNSIFIFSGGLLFIVICIVVVLYFNRAQGKNSDKAARFEFQRLSFAAVVLTGLGLIFLESMAMYYWAPSGSEAGKAIFEACKTVIPPIITLVLGYYFGKSDQVRSSQQPEERLEGNSETEVPKSGSSNLDSGEKTQLYKRS